MAFIEEIKTIDLEAAKETLVPEAIQALRDVLKFSPPDIKEKTAVDILEFYGYRRKDEPLSNAKIAFLQKNQLNVPADYFAGVLGALKDLRTVSSGEADVQIEVVEDDSADV